MASPLTEARQAVAAKLDGIGVRVYANPTEVPTPPCIQIFAPEQWISKMRLNGALVDVNVGVRVAVAIVGGNAEAYEYIESLLWSVISEIPVKGIIEPPRLDNSQQPNIYYVDVVTAVQAHD
jgi:hypothetical protein